MGKRNDEYRKARGIAAQLGGKFKNLFFSALGGVRKAVKVNGIQLYAALGDHIAGYGAVDAAGEQQRRRPFVPIGSPPTAGISSKYT